MNKTLKLLTLSIGTLLSCSTLAAQYPVTVTDVAGRMVTFDHQPQNIALSTSRVFPLLEIIYQQDAAKHLVAARDDMRFSAPSMYASYVEKYPSLKDVPVIGKIKSGEFDAERFINLKPKPDLFVVDLSNIKLAQDKGLIKKLDDAGIKVLAIDFREDPFNHTLQSVEALAKAVDREEQGKAFADYYRQHVKMLETTLAKHPEAAHKRVFIERAAGYSDSCCKTFATGNMGAYIPFLNATNIADKPLKGASSGTMSPETVITSQPDVYIMQTTGWVDKSGNVMNGIPLGYSPNKAAIKKATEGLMGRKWLKAVKGYQTKNVYSIYMPFYNSPYNLVAMEYFAKWIHPDLFSSLDPEKTFEEMNQKFGNRKLSGQFGQNNFEAM
ncbi:ABC transporter substrate-binding protein [uncultured Photobacterium sp.]|uniref:ABC transporter substrate-binding protein n=1 Tax=uncultured Photobacterium sp. TaxID=173973 RepID=UPI00261B0F46|nr:ABC transporter substrate-binding protein [uncultured Photobacterium sp.]